MIHHKLTFVLACILTLAPLIGSVPHNVEFVILMTSYNNEDLAENNLKSVAFQGSTNPYHIIYINDCSTDRTQEVVEEFISKHNLESKITLVENKNNVGALHNIYTANHERIPDHKVVVSVDGDDTLPHDEVLLRLEQEYIDPEVWMTYGTAWVVPDGRKKSKYIPNWIFEQNKIRKTPFRSQHLRTWKAGLFKKIKKEDLLYMEAFFPVAWDLAIMYPMLEMCGPITPGAINHSRYIKDILYIYNRDNPLNDFRKSRKHHRKIVNYIKNLESYKPIEHL